MAQMLKNGQAISPIQFVVTDADGALADADATPTGTCVVNGQDDGSISVTITKPTGTGIYYASCTLAGLSAPDWVQIRIAATVDTVATGGVLDVGQVVTDATYDALYAAVAGGPIEAGEEYEWSDGTNTKSVTATKA